jgi:hypothetical protein
VSKGPYWICNRIAFLCIKKSTIVVVTDQEQLVLTRNSTHIFELTVPREQGAILDLQQDSIPVYQKINSGGTTTIVVIQSQ